LNKATLTNFYLQQHAAHITEHILHNYIMLPHTHCFLPHSYYTSVNRLSQPLFAICDKYYCSRNIS